MKTHKSFTTTLGIAGAVGMTAVAILIITQRDQPASSRDALTRAAVAGNASSRNRADVKKFTESTMQPIESMPTGQITMSPEGRTIILPKNPPLAEMPLNPDSIVEARVTINGREQKLVPNELGDYAQLDIAPRAQIPIQLSFPKGQPNDPVMVRVEDGGHLDARDAAKLLTLDQSKMTNFQFQANADPGIYRIVVTKGSESSVLQFWAGPEMPFAHRIIGQNVANAN